MIFPKSRCLTRFIVSGMSFLRGAGLKANQRAVGCSPHLPSPSQHPSPAIAFMPHYLRLSRLVVIVSHRVQSWVIPPVPFTASNLHHTPWYYENWPSVRRFPGQPQLDFISWDNMQGSSFGRKTLPSRRLEGLIPQVVLFLPHVHTMQCTHALTRVHTHAYIHELTT